MCSHCCIIYFYFLVYEYSWVSSIKLRPLHLQARWNLMYWMFSDIWAAYTSVVGAANLVLFKMQVHSPHVFVRTMKYVLLDWVQRLNVYLRRNQFWNVIAYDCKMSVRRLISCSFVGSCQNLIIWEESKHTI